MVCAAAVSNYRRIWLDQHILLRRFRLGIVAVGTVLALAASPASALEPADTEPVAIRPLLAQSSDELSGAVLNDGVYLFGQQPIPDQLQTAYIVFEARAGQVIGAFYAPHSSFDCFQGEVQNTQLSLAITETYSQERYTYNLPLQDVAIAGTQGNQFAIEGYHQIDAIDGNDLRILGTCQSHFGQTI